MKKWLICGGRDANASLLRYVADVLDRVIILEGRPAAICHGDAKGIDSLAKTWAKERRITDVPFPAKWKKPDGTLDRSAGPIRNQQMLDTFQPDIVLAFPGGKGTDSMINQAKKAGVKVIKIPTPADLGYVSTRNTQNGNAA